MKYIIRSSPAMLDAEYLRELLSYKDLLLVLAYKEYRVRYAQTFLGVIWALLQPLMTVLVLTLIFGKAIRIDTGGIPYPVSVLAGMTGWAYFSFVVSQASRAILQDQSLIHKVYFPRLIMPLSKALVGLIDLLIALGLLGVVMLWYRVVPAPSILLVPLFIGLVVLLSLAVAIWVTALSVRYRDFQHVVPFMVQFGLYAAPVAYPASVIPERYQPYYFLLNPMASVVESIRNSVLGGPIPWVYVGTTALVTMALLLGAVTYFRRVEATMADVL